MPARDEHASYEYSEDERVIDTDDEPTYAGAVKVDPKLKAKQRKKLGQEKKEKKAGRPVTTRLARLARSLGATDALREIEKMTGRRPDGLSNAERVLQGKRPLGRPKKVQAELDVAKNDSQNAYGTMTSSQATEKSTAPSPTFSRNVQGTTTSSQVAEKSTATLPTPTPSPPHADKKKDIPAHLAELGKTGLERNLKRAESGRKKRGRPAGVKNRPKPVLDGAKSEPAKADSLGSDYLEATTRNDEGYHTHSPDKDGTKFTSSGEEMEGAEAKEAGSTADKCAGGPSLEGAEAREAETTNVQYAGGLSREHEPQPSETKERKLHNVGSEALFEEHSWAA
jgi:hypothetical protein